MCMHPPAKMYIRMVKRTTIEVDEQLLTRAKRALGQRTTRATVEAALRLAVESTQDERLRRVEGQRRYLQSIQDHLDVEVLASDEMWLSSASDADHRPS